MQQSVYRRHQIGRDVRERGRHAAIHCAALRQIVRENTRLVEETIETLLSTKEILRNGVQR